MANKDLGILYNSQMDYRIEEIHPQASLLAFSAVLAAEPRQVYEQSPLFLRDSPEVFAHLASKDWAFSDEDTQFLGHDLHPYPAKFIPQIPGTLISLLSDHGEIVCDPFGGSGTTALEAIRLGRRAISLDANPLAALIGRVKTARASTSCSHQLRSLHGLLYAELSTPSASANTMLDAYGQHAPEIANRGKWFSDTSFGELCCIRARISELQDDTARDIANLALSRSVLSASFQDSETRYKSVPRDIPVGDTLRRYVRELELVMRSVSRNASATRYGVAHFLTADSRTFGSDTIPNGSIDLVVTSPPYGNATDYHLYHRFRLLWLGFDPVALGHLEIGSHLKHQRESSGFDSYLADIRLSLRNISRVLKNGRYAALVIGDSVYDGRTYSTAELLAQECKAFDFDAACCIRRTVHRTKRSFTAAGRRASTENLLVLRKRASNTALVLEGPPYKLWPYENTLRDRETRCSRKSASGSGRPNPAIVKSADVAEVSRCRSLVFTHEVRYETGHSELTWQAILENGGAPMISARKDPKYVTHGLHPYKGKFYPQLAKALVNLSGISPGSSVLDPFCGSGTTLLEGYLNGLRAYGCDMHPLAAKIARAKIGILEVEPDLLTEVVANVLGALDREAPRGSADLDQFRTDCHEEIRNWFAAPIYRKINWILKTIRQRSTGVIQDYLEVVLSGLIRTVSQQEPSDLRIRYRSKPLSDYDVCGFYRDQLSQQFSRVEKFWKIRGHAPHAFAHARAIEGDNRLEQTYRTLGVAPDSVDLVLTSPPYAMALPYIDTDRLSLLTLLGLSAAQRRPLEQSLTGSRELLVSARESLEEELDRSDKLPDVCIKFLRQILGKVGRSSSSGFRKKNMPALLYRFLRDMSVALTEVHKVCKRGADAMIVIGDSRMTIEGKSVLIPTTKHLEAIAEQSGFRLIERMDISVTTENLVHIGNAIKENAVLWLRKVFT